LDGWAFARSGKRLAAAVFLSAALLAGGIVRPPAASATDATDTEAAAAPGATQPAPDAASGAASDTAPQNRIRAFHDAAGAVYEAVKRGDHGQVLRRLGEAESRLRELPLAEIRTAEGIEALAKTVAEMKRAAAAVTPDPDRLEKAAAALRLAADELAHPERPLWHQYRPLLADDIDQLERLAKGKRRLPAEAAATYERLAGHYRLIRTAALLRGEPWKVERGDAVLTYAGRLIRAADADPALISGLFAPLREAMAGLFPPDPDAPPATVPVYVPPPWGFSAAIGSLILTVLAWSGWRRFRFERAGGARQNGPDRPREDAASRWLRR
jgi:hypothetical protein